MERLMKLSSVIFMIFLSGTAMSEVPHQINYQGHLTDYLGEELDGEFDFVFYLYDAPAAGNLLWSEVQTDVLVNEGVFHIILGSENELDLDFSAHYWLEIAVEGEVLSPRQLMTSVGQAYISENAEDVYGRDINPRTVSITGYGGMVIDETGQWVGDPTGLKGPTGPSGPAGEPGPVGHTGPQGPQGDTGLMGLMGPEGPMGYTGPQGPRGDTGPAGYTGPQGPTGPVAGADMQLIYNDAGTAAGSEIYYDDQSQFLGIGESNPQSRLQVNGMVHSMSGGYKFPDGSVQVSAITENGGIIRGTVYSPSNNLTASDDAQKSFSGTSWQKIKEMYIPANVMVSTLRFKFDTRSSMVNQHLRATIYRNGEPIGDEHHTQVDSWTTITEDIEGWKEGDLIELWAKMGYSSHTGYIRNFRIYGTGQYVYSDDAPDWPTD